MQLLTAASLPPAALFVAASAIVGVTKKAASENAATSTAKRVCLMRMLYLPFKCYGRSEILARGSRGSASTRVAGGPGRSAGPPRLERRNPSRKPLPRGRRSLQAAIRQGFAGLSRRKRGAGLVQINTALQHPRYRASSR